MDDPLDYHGGAGVSNARLASFCLLCKNNARTKGMADLGLADHHRLHAALIDEEISVTKVHSKVERSM